MKTFNGSVAIALATVLSATVLLVGCGKKKAPATVAPYIPPIAPAPIGWGCTGCPGGSQFILSAVGFVRGFSGQPDMELSLEFYSNGQVANQPGAVNQPIYGPIFAAGVLRVYRNDTPQLCNIPPGTYVIQPYQGQAGQMQMQSFAITLQANGPVQAVIEMPNNFLTAQAPPIIGMDGKSYPFAIGGGGFNGNMAITPVGAQCYNNRFTISE